MLTLRCHKPCLSSSCTLTPDSFKGEVEELDAVAVVGSAVDGHVEVVLSDLTGRAFRSGGSLEASRDGVDEGLEAVELIAEWGRLDLRIGRWIGGSNILRRRELERGGMRTLLQAEIPNAECEAWAGGRCASRLRQIRGPGAGLDFRNLAVGAEVVW